jgi:hypothetical protein
LRKEKIALKRKLQLANETPQQRNRRLDRLRRRAKHKKANEKPCKANQGARTITNGSAVPSNSRRKQATPRKTKEATIIFQFDNPTNTKNDDSSNSKINVIFSIT